MGVKLNSKQMAQLQFLEPFARQMFSMGTFIEQMSMPKADEAIGRSLLRIVSSSKVQAMGLGLARMADNLSQLEQTARRTGGGVSKFRSLREMHTALKQSYDIALKNATTEKHDEEEDADATPPAAPAPSGH